MGSLAALQYTVLILYVLTAARPSETIPCQAISKTLARECPHFDTISMGKLPTIPSNQSARQTCQNYVLALGCVYEVMDHPECGIASKLPFHIQSSAVEHMCSYQKEYDASAPCFRAAESSVEECMQRMVKSMDETKGSVCGLFTKAIACAYDSVKTRTVECRVSDARRMAELMAAFFKPTQILLGCDISPRNRRDSVGEGLSGNRSQEPVTLTTSSATLKPLGVLGSEQGDLMSLSADVASTFVNTNLSEGEIPTEVSIQDSVLAANTDVLVNHIQMVSAHKGSNLSEGGGSALTPGQSEAQVQDDSESESDTDKGASSGQSQLLCGVGLLNIVVLMLNLLP